MVRSTLVILALSVAIATPTSSFAACPRDAAIVEVGPLTSSAEAGTLGYTCFETSEARPAELPPRERGAVRRFGSGASDPEKDTLGFSSGD